MERKHSGDGERQRVKECGLQIGNEASWEFINNGACDRKKQRGQRAKGNVDQEGFKDRVLKKKKKSVLSPCPLPETLEENKHISPLSAPAGRKPNVSGVYSQDKLLWWLSEQRFSCVDPDHPAGYVCM